MTYGCSRVFIGGISSDVSKDDIGNEFGKYGKLKNIWVAQNPPGFAFVEYDDNRDADEAVKSLNGANLFNENMRIRVEHSKTRHGDQKSSNRRGRGRDGGNFRGSSSNNNFRSLNSTQFKPKSRFLNSNANFRGGRSGRGRPLNSSSRFGQSSSRPRLNDGQSQRFNKPNTGPRFGNQNGGRRGPQANNDNNSFFNNNRDSQFNSGGYKNNFRNRSAIEK